MSGEPPRATWKMPLLPEQAEWFADQTKHASHINPCVRLYGMGPENTRCKECRLLRRKGGHAKTYFKCELRGDTNGPATDHRANWPACGRFVAASEPRGAVSSPGSSQ